MVGGDSATPTPTGGQRRMSIDGVGSQLVDVDSTPGLSMPPSLAGSGGFPNSRAGLGFFCES